MDQISKSYLVYEKEWIAMWKCNKNVYLFKGIPVK